jgi:hypothetical protein
VFLRVKSISGLIPVYARATRGYLGLRPALRARPQSMSVDCSLELRRKALERLSLFTLSIWDHVRISPQECLEFVPHDLSDERRRSTRSQHSRRRVVPQIVQARRRQLCLAREALKGVSDRSTWPLFAV